MALKFCCGTLCLLMFLLSPGSGETETRTNPSMPNHNVPADTTDDNFKESGNDTLYITAFRRLSELFVDGTEYLTNNGDDNPNTPYSFSIHSDTRLVAMKANNDIKPSCGGILASTVSNSIITDIIIFTCVHTKNPGWMRLGYDDSEWTEALRYEDNTAGRAHCSQADPIENINPNAKWIWHYRESDPTVCCRGYTNFCAISSPCLNGGTCLKNSLEMCECPPDFTGKYCETGTGEPMTGSTTATTTTYVPPTTSSNETEMGNDTLVITAFSRLGELFVDGTAYLTNNSDNNPNTPHYVNINSDARLIAMLAINDVKPSCGGILASTVSNSIRTDIIIFKCVHTNYLGWMRLGYDDSQWTEARKYEDNTAGRADCYQDDPIANINPNAKWIWHVRESDPYVCCRGYTNFCAISSPCLNGGTCLKNSLDMCECPPQFTGKYCETGIVESSANPMTGSTTDVSTTTTYVPPTTSSIYESSANPMTGSTTDVSTTTTYVPPTTSSNETDPGIDTLYITAFRRLSELFVDGTAYLTNNSDDNPNTPYFVNINSDARLIAMMAINDVKPSCGGVLASTVSNSIRTDIIIFKCVHFNYLGWMRLGYDDSQWTEALRYEDNTAGRADCYQDDPIDNINPNAKWIWHVRESDPYVCCRGYTNFCAISSPCLNGGTCLKNSLEMCECPPQFTGKYCETGFGEPITTSTTYVPPTTSSNETESGNDTLVITAFSRLGELFVDGSAFMTDNGDNNPNTPYYISINSDARLIAMLAINDVKPSCGGVLASTVSNSIRTDIVIFKCVHTNYLGWMRLGYNDSDWTEALRYEDNTAGRSECYQDDPIENINPNAKWIWHIREVDPFVCCRGYTNFCAISSPCLNGGTCLKNSLEMCECPPQFTGKYCETGIDESSPNPMTSGTTTEVPMTTEYVSPTSSSDVSSTTEPTTSTTSLIVTTTSSVPSIPGPDPCSNYQFIDMADGYRSSDFYSCYSSISLCDSSLKNDTWYRFEHDAGNRLLEQPIDPWFCGTQAPIYLDGKHDINEFEAVAQACAVYSTDNTCGWSGQVLIRSCSLSGEKFFVYLLSVPPACPLAYCVDASSHRQCIPPEVWISDEFRCGEPSSSTASTPTTPSASCGEAPSSGWGEWGSWSQCSAACDYGLQSRRRVCGDLPCEGLSTEFQSCNEIACPINSEESVQGVVLLLVSVSYTTSEEFLLMVLQYEAIIYGQLRISLNEICSHNGALCLGTDYTGSGPLEYVSSGGVYRAQGGLTQHSDGTISLHTIAVGNETLCGSSECVIPYDTMYLAANESTNDIYMNTGILIEDISSPSSIVNPGDDSSDCPTDTCVVPLTVCLVVSLAMIAIIAAVLAATQCGGQRSEQHKENSRNKDGKRQKDRRSSNNYTESNNSEDDSHDERDGESKRKRTSSKDKVSNKRNDGSKSHSSHDRTRTTNSTTNDQYFRNEMRNDGSERHSSHDRTRTTNSTTNDQYFRNEMYTDGNIQRQHAHISHQGNSDPFERKSEKSPEETNGRTSPSSPKRNKSSQNRLVQEQLSHSSMHSFNDASMDKERHTSTSSERTLTTMCTCGSLVQILIDKTTGELIQTESYATVNTQRQHAQINHQRNSESFERISEKSSEEANGRTSPLPPKRNNRSKNKLMLEQSSHSSMHSFNDASMDKERHTSTDSERTLTTKGVGDSSIQITIDATYGEPIQDEWRRKEREGTGEQSGIQFSELYKIEGYKTISDV